jgi:hypothetical protein
MKWVGPPCILSKITLQIGPVLRRLPRQRPSASVFLATADDIRDAAAQWSLALRRIAMIEPKMGVDLKRGWIGSRSGPARGRAVSNVPPPQHLCLPVQGDAEAGPRKARRRASASLSHSCARPDRNARSLHGQCRQEGRASLVAGVPLKRAGSPEEIADAIVFVASAKASFITGQVIAVNGGKTAS